MSSSSIPLHVSDEGFDSDEDIGGISRPFDPEKIKVKTEPRSLDLILKRIEHNEIDLSPDFQRRARVWPTWKKSQLIESLLLRIPLPVFYVSAASNDIWSVVDGLQRLTTIDDFYNNDFSLSGLEYLKHLEGETYGSLPRTFQRRIEETIIVIHIIEPGTPDDVMINIFKRINTGGEPLRAQEIRNALVKGPVRAFLRKLASSPAFLEATENSIKDTRMDAQECAARFCAFYIQDYTEFGETELDAFILQSMQIISRMSDDERSEIENAFNQAMRGAYAMLGRYAFRKFFEVDGRRGPISKALFEATSVNIAKLTKNDVRRLSKKQDEIIFDMANLISNDKDFFTAISSSTGSKKNVLKRFSILEEFFAEYCDD